METPPSFPSAPLPWPPPPPVHLSVGSSTADKVLVVVPTAVCVVTALPLLALASVGLAISTDAGAVGGLLLSGGIGGPLVFVLVWALFRVFRYGAYVQGTELIERGAFSTRRVDLATARLLRLTDVNRGLNSTDLIPTVEAHDDAQGRSAKAHFRRARAGFIPQSEVAALAAAIQAGTRSGLAAEQAEQVIRELYLRAYPSHPGG